MGIRLGRFTFDLAAHSLWAGDVPVRLPRKALDVLALLLEHRGCLVLRETIFTTVWPEGFVQDGNLTQTIYLLRKVFADDPVVRIENVPRRGYRLIVEPMQRRALQRRAVVAFGGMVTLLALLLTAVRVTSSGAAALSPAAAADYRIALFHYVRFSNHPLSRIYFERTVREAPRRPEGYAGLALLDAFEAYGGRDRPAACLRGEGEDTAAFRLGRIALADSAAAMLQLFCGHDPAGAARDLHAALQLDSNDSIALVLAARLMVWSGKPAEALPIARRAVAADPTSPESLIVLALARYYTSDFRSAAAIFARVLEIHPDYEPAMELLAESYDGAHEFASADAVLQRAARLGYANWAVPLEIRLQALRGRNDAARAALRRLHPNADPEAVAAADVAAGEDRSALAELDAARTHSTLAVQADWMLDARFVPLRERFPQRAAGFITWSPARFRIADNPAP